MVLLLQLFWNICLMREGPERVPGQTGFVLAVLVVLLVVSLLFAAMLGSQFGLMAIATQVIASAAATATMVWFALYVQELPNRFNATVGALLGTDLVLVCVFGALLLVARAAGLDPTAIVVLIQLWNLVIVGFIMHKALNISFPLGLAVGLFIQLFSLTISQVAAT